MVSLRRPRSWPNWMGGESVTEVEGNRHYNVRPVRNHLQRQALANMLEQAKEEPDARLGATFTDRRTAEGLASQIRCAVYLSQESSDVSSHRNMPSRAKAKGNGVVIIRHGSGPTGVDEEMMDEIKDAEELVNPDETLFVVDSMTDTGRVNTASQGVQRLPTLDGVVRSQTPDGDTRGGAAISIRTVHSLSSLSVRARRWRAIDRKFHPRAWPTEYRHGRS